MGTAGAASQLSRWPSRLASPTRKPGQTAVVSRLMPFRSPSFMPSGVTVSGVTKDSLGAILGSCVVQLFRTTDDAIIAETTSDATTGVYTFYPTVSGPFYVVAYKAGAPDVAGTTVNTLIPA